jgi:hypothetical protein
MINANLSQYLDNGWYTDCELYYKGYIYFCEGYYENIEIPKDFHFTIYKYPVYIVEEIYYKRVDPKAIDELVYDEYASDEYEMKEKFLQAKIFEGKSFWEVEKELAWYEAYGLE